MNDNSLKLFEVYNGESWYIAARSEEHARGWAKEKFHIEAGSITEKPMDEYLIIHIGDPLAASLPAKPYYEHGSGWFCGATIRQWLSVHADGDLVCSSH